MDVCDYCGEVFDPYVWCDNPIACDMISCKELLHKAGYDNLCNPCRIKLEQIITLATTREGKIYL